MNIDKNMVAIMVALIALLGVVLGASIATILGFVFTKKLEDTKERNNIKREVYENFLISIQMIFFTGSLALLKDDDERNNVKLSFLNNYERIKLWGSMEVIEAISMDGLYVTRQKK